MLPEKQKAICFSQYKVFLSKEAEGRILTFSLQLLRTVTSTIMQDHLMLVMMV